MDEVTADPLADVVEDQHLPDPEPGDYGYEPGDDPTPEENAAIDAEVDALLGMLGGPTAEDQPAEPPGDRPAAGLDPAALESWRATSIVALANVSEKTLNVLRDTGTFTVGGIIDLYEGWDPAGDDPLVAALNLTGWYAGELQAAVARTLSATTLDPNAVLPWVFMKQAAAEAPASALELPPDPPAADAEDYTANQEVVIPPAAEASGEPVADPPGSATPDPLAAGGNVLGAWRDMPLPAFANSLLQNAVDGTGAATHGELDAAIRGSADKLPFGLSDYLLIHLYDYMAKAAEGDPAFVPYTKGWQGPEARAEAEERRKRELDAFDAETAHMMNELFGELVAAKAKHVRLKTDASFAKKSVDEKLKELEELHQKRAEEREYPRLIPSSAPPIVVNEGAEEKSRQADRDRPKRAKEAAAATPAAAEPVAPGELSDELSQQLMMEFPLDTHRWERFGATAKMMEILRNGVTKKHGAKPMRVFGDIARFNKPQGEGGFTAYLTDLKGWGDKMQKDWDEVQNSFFAAWPNGVGVAFAREKGYLEDTTHPEAPADGQQVDDAGAPARADRRPGAGGGGDRQPEAGGPAPAARTHKKPGKPKPKKQPAPKRAGNGNGKPAKFKVPPFTPTSRFGNGGKPARPQPKPAPRRKPHAANPGKKGKK